MTSWPSRRSDCSRCRLMNSVPPTMRTRTLADRDRDAGGGAGDAVDHADLVGDEPADAVQRGALHLGDEIVGAGHRIQVREGGAVSGDAAELLLDRLGLAGSGLDQHVRFHAALGGLGCHGSRLQRWVEPRYCVSVERNYAGRSTNRPASTSTRMPRSSVWLAGSNRAVSLWLAAPYLRVSDSPADSSPSRVISRNR